MNRAIVIAGPTGVGKTKISIDLASELNAEIISSDSAQVYKGLNIGTAKITEKEMQGIKHHLIDIVEPISKYSVGNFEKDVNKIFLKYIENKIPYLFLKCGITLDGKIATRSGKSKWITNEIAREKVQFLRTKFMAIMVGINTVLKDNPSLDSRLDEKKFGIEKRNPFRVVIDPNLESPIEAKFLNFNDGKAIIVTSNDNRELEKIKEYKNLGTRFIFLEGKIFKMKNILKELGKLEIDSVLLEGGSGLISTAFKENIINAGEIFIAPKIIGDNSAIPFINGFNFDNMEDVFKLPNPKFNIYGDNISIEFEKNE